MDNKTDLKDALKLFKDNEELGYYTKIMMPMGYNLFPFFDCDYESMSLKDELNNRKEELVKLNNILDLHFLNNINMIKAELSCQKFNINSEELNWITHYLECCDFDLAILSNCDIRVLSSQGLEEDDTIGKLLQIWKDNKIIFYVHITQQNSHDIVKSKFRLNKVTNEDKLNKLCELYTKMEYELK